LPNTRRRFFSFLVVLAAFSGCLNAQTTCPSSSVVRFQTNLGGIDVVLTPTVTPMTVANFMTYVCSGAYTAGDLTVNGEQVPYVGTIIHRSLTIAAAVPPYVIQGGGYALDGLIPTLIPFNSPVANEFSISNTRGTIAMAQNSSGIDSATNQWYFNTADNSSTLDSQDFTVFGNVGNNPSLAVMDAINALPTYGENYGPDEDFANLPLINYSCPNTNDCPLIKVANFVFVNSVAPISPVMPSAGFVDAATSLSSSTGISPGEMISLYGTELGPTQGTQLELDSTGSFITTSLEGTKVTFNGIAGPMLYTSTGQLNVLVPYEVAGQSTVNIVVSYLGVAAPSVKLPVVAATPALFTQSQNGKGDAAIVHPDGTVVSTANPASVGDTLELYGEGYGVAAPNLADGAIVTGSLSFTGIALLIDSQQVATQYTGAAGSEVNGMMQINFKVPQLTPGSHQIQIQVGGVKSPTGVNLQTQ
jgi:uncharacterized protein (TIGR03437 family)